MNPKVDWFFTKPTNWKEEYAQLRTIVLGCGLTEELKWGVPCYTDENNNNIVLIHGFKEYCAILFPKGVLLKDSKNILIQQTENVQAARQVRFTSVEQISDMAPVLKSYIKEAIKVDKAGLEVNYKKVREFKIPPEFQTKLDDDSTLKAAFETLTPGRQKGYIFYFSQAKLAKTREARVEKCIPKILVGKGLED